MYGFEVWRLGAFAGSMVPGVIVVLALLRRGERSLAPRLLWVALASGATIAILPYTLTLIEPILSYGLPPFYANALKAFGFAGLGEEGAKLLACWWIVRPFYLNRNGRDFILACAGVGLGFALVENVAYVMRASDQWKDVALSRALTSVPIHAFLGMGLGAGLAAAQQRGGVIKTFFMLSSYFLAAVLHACYDFPLFTAENFPLTPLQINALAATFSLLPQTLVALIMIGAIAAISAWALWALHICRLRGARDAHPPVFRVSRWIIIDRILFSDAAGVMAGGAFLGFGAFILVVGVGSGFAGALPVTLLLYVSTGLILLALGFAFGDAALMRCLRRPQLVFLFAGGLAQKFRLPAGAGRITAALIGCALCYWSYFGVREGVARVLTSSGETRLNNGAVEAAMENFSSALVFKNDFTAALFGRVSAQLALQRYDEALDTIQGIVSITPQNPDAYVARAVIHRIRHETQPAIEDFNRALELKPDDPEILIARGSASLDEGDLNSASKDLDLALSIKPNLMSAHLLRSQIYFQQDDLDGVARESSIVLKQEPKSASAAFSRGRALFLKGEYTRALMDFRAAMQNGERGYVGLWLYLAGAHIGQDIQATQEVMVWAQVMPQNAWPFPLVKFFLGAESVEDLKSAAQTNDQRCEMNFYVAELMLLEKNMNARAIEIFQRAASSCPKDFIEYDGARIELKKLTTAAKSNETLFKTYSWRFSPAVEDAPPQLEMIAQALGNAIDYRLTLEPADNPPSVATPTTGYTLSLRIQRPGEAEPPAEGAINLFVEGMDDAAPLAGANHLSRVDDHLHTLSPEESRAARSTRSAFLAKLSFSARNSSDVKVYLAKLSEADAQTALVAMANSQYLALKSENSYTPFDKIAIDDQARSVIRQALNSFASDGKPSLK